MISDRLQSAIEKLTGKRYWSDFSESEQESAARELEDFYQKYHRLQAQVRDLKEEQNQKQDQKSGTAGSADSQVPTYKTSSKKTNSSSSSSSGKVRTKPYSEFNWLEKVIWNAKKIFRNK
jgi:hypothetical protein